MSTSSSANLLSQLSSNISVESVSSEASPSPAASSVSSASSVTVDVDAPSDGGVKVTPSTGGVKVPPSISVKKSVSSDTPSPANVQLPAGISITSISPDQIKKSTVPEQNKKPSDSSETDLWDQFEKFRKWQESLSSSSTEPSSSSSSSPASSINSFLNKPGNASISRVQASSSSPKTVNAPITRASTNTPINRAPINTRRQSLPYQRRPNAITTQQPTLLSNQTLNQPLNPTAFAPGAFKCFSKSRQQMAITRNSRRYPQLNSEQLKRQASTFMAAPTPQILAQMRQEGFAKDFQVENCRSSSEYLHCLLGYGLHQALNFPIMGVFYLELVRLIMKHVDKFSSNEKVKLIQVSNVCEDILRQNSTRDDFLPVDAMDKIIEEAIKEEGNIKKMIDEFNNEQQQGSISKTTTTSSKPEISYLASQVSNDINRKLNQFSNISVSLSSEPKPDLDSTQTSEAADSSVVIDLDEVEDPVIDIDSNVKKVSSNLTVSGPNNRVLNGPNTRLSNRILNGPNTRFLSTQNTRLNISNTPNTIYSNGPNTRFSNLRRKKNKRHQPKQAVQPHLVKPLNLSDDLATLLGVESGSKLSRQDVVKKLWEYVKEKKLQDTENGQWLTPDEAMEPIFGKEKIRGFGMVKFLRGHLTD